MVFQSKIFWNNDTIEWSEANKAHYDTRQAL